MERGTSSPTTRDSGLWALTADAWIDELGEDEVGPSWSKVYASGHKAREYTSGPAWLLAERGQVWWGSGWAEEPPQQAGVPVLSQ